MRRLAITLLMLLLGATAWCDTYLLSVGVSDYCDQLNYRDIRDLRVAANDAEAFARFYAEADSRLHSRVLTDSRATRRDMLRHMSELFSQADSSDYIVLFMACHGGRGCFVMHDSLVSYEEIIEVMARSAAKNKMIYTDACLSGGMQREGASSKDRSVISSYKILCFFSSRDNEISYESSEMDNGIFTTYLIEGLRGKADSNNDKIVTAHELWRYVSGSVAKMTDGSQHPNMWGKFDRDMPMIRLR